jgi:hypothetical protein
MESEKGTYTNEVTEDDFDDNELQGDGSHSSSSNEVSGGHTIFEVRFLNCNEPDNKDRLTYAQRYINLSSVIYFSTIVLCSWEGLAISFQFALLNGGPSALFYGCIFVAFGGTAVAFSMAEMASMYVRIIFMTAMRLFFLNFAQRSSSWCTVSMVCQVRTICTKVLGLASRYH